MKMEMRSKSSPEQFAVLLEFMESNGDVGKGQRDPQSRERSDRLWEKLVKLLNSVRGGVRRSTEKWKMVWACWKAKTKKKALALRHRASGAGDGPNTGQTLTTYEQRLLTLIGLSAGANRRGLDNPPFETHFVKLHRGSPSTNSHVSSENELTFDVIPVHFMEDSRKGTRLLQPPRECPPSTTSTPMPVPLPASKHHRVLQRTANPSVQTPSKIPTMRQRRMLRNQILRRKTQARFELSHSEFVTIEHLRFQLEEAREARNHEREMEKLQLESRRIAMEEDRNEVLNRLATVVAKIIDILPQATPSSKIYN